MARHANKGAASTPAVHFELEARVRKGKAEIVRVPDSTDESAEVILSLPGRLLPKDKRGKRLGLDSKDLGKRLERAFQSAVRRATAD